MFPDPDVERARHDRVDEERWVVRERAERVEEMTPLPSSLGPRVRLRLRHDRELRELRQRQEQEMRELHDPDCPRTAHGGPCSGPLRFEHPSETELERYERHLDAIEAVLRQQFTAWGLRLPRDRALVRELAEACFAAADTGI